MENPGWLADGITHVVVKEDLQILVKNILLELEIRGHWLFSPVFLLISCLVTLFDLAEPSFPLQQSWVMVSKELISLLHLSMLHLEEDKTTVSQEVSRMKMKAGPLVGPKAKKRNQTQHLILIL